MGQRARKLTAKDANEKLATPPADWGGTGGAVGQRRRGLSARRESTERASTTGRGGFSCAAWRSRRSCSTGVWRPILAPCGPTGRHPYAELSLQQYLRESERVQD
jgi:hypothetical protein